MNKILLSFFICIYTVGLLSAQSDEDALYLKKIHDFTLTKSKSYSWLEQLTIKAGPRIAGSMAYDNAVKLTSKQMMEAGASEVRLQECTVTGWDRGMKEQAYIVNKGKNNKWLKVLSLGNTIGTGPKGLQAEVIEVKSLDEIRALGKSKIMGKIVFYNRPMDPTQILTFSAYGGGVDQRVYGAATAAEYGAVASLIRSMSLRQDDFPHTGTSIYKDGVTKIPSLSVSTNDANVLSEALTKGKVEVFIKNTSKVMPKKVNHTVIGEIKGSTYPDQIILIGGHLDAWDVGEGAHDDGAGCVQAMQVLHTLTSMGYQPKRTIRCVLFANEENGLAGGTQYAKESNEKKEFHLAALESDSGGFVPRGFGFDADTSVFKTYYKKVSEWLPLFESYGLQFKIGGGGADINPLKSQKGLLIGLRPDSQRYFDYHHTAIDKFEAVNKRELELGAAAMTSLIYLLDKYGI